MPATAKYPDSLRQQAVALSLQGRGYKAIATALGLPRDTVRNWITVYRLTGRREPQNPGPKTPSLSERERLFAPAREEYEQGADSLLTIAQKHGVNYVNLRYFLQRYHPESALLHTYARQAAQLREELSAQLATLQKTGDQVLQQMRQELEAQLQRLRPTLP